TGSTGHLGGLVARHLTDVRLRLVVRDADRAPDLPGSEVRVASYADTGACVTAFEGVDTLLLVSAGEAHDRREQHRSVIRAAAEAGVAHVVYTSFVGADAEATFTLGRDHADAESALRDSGMAWTFLRDNFYLDVLPLFADRDGVIRGPAGEGRVAAVARADVADVATAVLRDPRAHAGATYDLTGPEALTLAEVAERAGRVLGRRLGFEDQSVDEAYASRRAAYDAEQWQLDAWVSTYTAIRDGSVAQVSDDVRRVTGHAPRTLEEALAR
ncbi:SDR family oxidoreductase, partial [Nocardioides sp.]|uniref:SDR family oxidoreductase n=1 Tax=Nocardioides sp. TaxID=35761 RepID=UPI00273701D4